MNTEQLLLDKFQGSPLLSIEQVADILHRSKDGLRILFLATLSSPKNSEILDLKSVAVFTSKLKALRG